MRDAYEQVDAIGWRQAAGGSTRACRLFLHAQRFRIYQRDYGVGSHARRFFFFFFFFFSAATGEDVEE